MHGSQHCLRPAGLVGVLVLAMGVVVWGADLNTFERGADEPRVPNEIADLCDGPPSDLDHSAIESKDRAAAETCAAASDPGDPEPTPPQAKAADEGRGRGNAAVEEPPLEITPNTLRIETVGAPEKGVWVAMPGFSELGTPSFSRDAQWIAFDGYRGGYNNSPAECWIARRDGRELTRLAVGATPSWSPDGKRLLFMRDEANDPKHTSGVFLIDRDGTHERRLCDGRWPQWSPDGKSIVFSLGGQPGGGLRVGATICTANADGTNLKDIVPGDCPSWSPDGKRIAYCDLVEPKAPPTIRVVDLKDRTVTTVGIGWYRANWTPDSKSLVANGVSGPQRIGMVSWPVEEHAKPSPLFAEFESPFSPCPSGDGNLFIFIAKRPKPDKR